MHRRDFLRFSAAAAVASPAVARAQFSGGRPITILVPFPAGGGADVLARIVTKYMSESIGVPIVVQNQPGAGGAIAFGQAARAEPDGHTLIWLSVSYPVMVATVNNLPFDPEKDFSPICHVGQNPFVLVVNPKVPATSVKELVDLAKAQPGVLNFAHNGSATLTNLVVELLKIQAGIDVAQIAYRGDNFSSADVVAGHVQAMFSNAPVSLPHVREGRLRALAVTSPQRSPSAPELPTMIEAGYPDFQVVVWQGISARAGTPRPIIERLNAAAREALQVPEVAARFQSLGSERVGSSPEEFSQLISRELATWKDVVKRSGVKPT